MTTTSGFRIATASSMRGPSRHRPDDRVVAAEHPHEAIEDGLVVVDEQDARLRQCAAARQTE